MSTPVGTVYQSNPLDAPNEHDFPLPAAGPRAERANWGPNADQPPQCAQPVRLVFHMTRSSVNPSPEAPHNSFVDTPERKADLPPSYTEFRGARRESPHLIDEMLDSIQHAVSTMLRELILLVVDNRKTLIKGAKILAGAVIISTFAGYIPSLAGSIAHLTSSVLAHNVSLFVAVGKVTLCALGVLFGLSLVLPSRSEAPKAIPSYSFV